MFVKVTNGNIDQFPYTVGQLRRDNPNTSFPKTIPDETLAKHNVYPVTRQTEPSYTERTQKIELEASPIMSNGAWSIGWNVVNKTDGEISEYDASIAETNRARRNELLSETDYFALSDVIMSDSMQLWRQALRDITEHINWPHLQESDWPVKP